MNKNFKIFQINGFTGLLFLGFILTCLFSGFVIFPVWLVALGWNEFIVHFGLPAINYFQASLLWSIVLILVYLSLRSSVHIKVHSSEEELSESEINEIINEIEDKEEDSSREE